MQVSQQHPTAHNPPPQVSNLSLHNGSSHQAPRRALWTDRDMVLAPSAAEGTSLLGPWRGRAAQLCHRTGAAPSNDFKERGPEGSRAAGQLRPTAGDCTGTGLPGAAAGWGLPGAPGIPRSRAA